MHYRIFILTVIFFTTGNQWIFSRPNLEIQDNVLKFSQKNRVIAEIKKSANERDFFEVIIYDKKNDNKKTAGCFENLGARQSFEFYSNCQRSKPVLIFKLNGLHEIFNQKNENQGKITKDQEQIIFKPNNQKWNQFYLDKNTKQIRINKKMEKSYKLIDTANLIGNLGIINEAIVTAVFVYLYDHLNLN